jgi:phosphoribosylamine--glycine ligase
MFPGEIGPPTGEMGTSMYWGPPNKIFNETLGKLSEVFKQAGYVGYIDINCMINSRGIYPLEFTCRFGYPTISIQMEGITSPWGEFLSATAKGENYELKTKKGFQIGVVVAVPPFPFNDPSAFRRYSEGKPVLFKKPELEGIHIGDIKLLDNQWVLAGNSGYSLIVTGSGMTMDDARKQAYRRIKNIMIPNMFYRTDIGMRWFTDSDKLQAWGFLY